MDIFYRSHSIRKQAIIDLCGAAFFLLPMCILIILVGLPYVTQSWMVMEGSREAGGIHGIFILKTAIICFTVLLGLQGVSQIGNSLVVLSEKSNDT